MGKKRHRIVKARDCVVLQTRNGESFIGVDVADEDDAFNTAQAMQEILDDVRAEERASIKRKMLSYRRHQGPDANHLIRIDVFLEWLDARDKRQKGKQ